MKKLLFAAALVLMVVAGCTFFQKAEEIPAEPIQSQLEKKIGIVSTAQDQGLLAAPSKFALTSDTNEKIFIDALSVNLKKYTKRRVEVEGKWNEPKTIFMVDTVTSIGQETQIKQSYMNTEVGIKFQYPSIWSLVATKDILGLQKIVITPYEVAQEESSSVDTITIERSENNKKLSARDWLSLDDQYRSKDPLETNTTYQQSSVGIAQLDAVKKTIGSGEKVEFFVARDLYIYRFTHSTVSDSDKDLYRNEFFNLMASFEFVPLTPGEATTTPVLPDSTTANPTDKLTTLTPASGQVTPPLSELAKEELAKRAKAEADAKAAELAKVAAALKTSDAATARQNFITYIKQNISTLAPEAPTSGTWTATQFEFVAPEGQSENFNAIYVTYSSGTEVRKILLSVSDRTTPSSVKQVAYFKQGSVADWDLASGTDSAKTGEKTVIKDGAAPTEAVTVKKGMRLLESRSWKIKIQYPANYYWSFANGGYQFSNKPISGNNALLTLTKGPSNIAVSQTSIGEIGGRPATEYQSQMSENYGVCVQGKEQFCINGTANTPELIAMKASLQAIAKEMLATLQENQ
ncbi:MAG: hypothetical protein WCT53_00375 [Candidatus Gracilibacteria bacterium]